MAKAKKAAPAKAKAAKKDETGSKSVVSSKYVGNYSFSDQKTASGKRKSFDNQDRVAAALRGKSVDELAKIAKENDLGDQFNAKWKNLNPGMCRMSLGNSLRGKLRKEGRIQVEGKGIRAEAGSAPAEKPKKTASRRKASAAEGSTAAST